MIGIEDDGIITRMLKRHVVKCILFCCTCKTSRDDDVMRPFVRRYDDNYRTLVFLHWIRRSL